MLFRSSIVPGDPANDILSFSFIGLETKEVKIDRQTVINVQLASSSLEIDEVVAIGYGTVRKRDVTGSVASISGQQLTAVPVANVAQALQGRLPGVNVTSQDGRPDAAISIRVRGGGSISQSNDPLILIDGIPGNISDIPSELVESIDVLKRSEERRVGKECGVICISRWSPDQ